MPVDPLDYDPDELRDLAGVDGYERVLGEDGFVWLQPAVEDDEPDPEAVEEWARMVTRGNTKPYLETLPTDEDAEATIYEWLTYLVERVGLEGCLEALQYYHALDWLGDAAAEELEDYLFGVDPVEGNEADELEAADHMRSLAFVGRLAANQDSV